MMRKAVIVGTGAGGATVARELQGKFDVTILESGKPFHPFKFNLPFVEYFKKTGLLFNPREIQILFPFMKICKIGSNTILVNGIGTGGTTTLSTGNAIRVDTEIKKLGINLDSEFEEIYREIPITFEHQRLWRKTTTRLFDICLEMKLDPKPLPKMGDYSRCVNCGQCVLGCAHGVKWDSRSYLSEAINRGAKLITNCKVKSIRIKNGKAVGVLTHKKQFIPADLVILSAGGLGTPVILENSGIECEKNLFVDYVLTVAAEWKNSLQNKEISMPFVVQRDHFILSPYFDHLSYYFNKKWKYPAKDTLGIMIKLADEGSGWIEKGKINKFLTESDEKRLNEGVEICTEIFSRLGVKKENLFLGSLNAGHPGGMLPLTASEAGTFHNKKLPDGLYVADSTLLPRSLGNPPILTIIAMAKRISKLCIEQAKV